MNYPKIESKSLLVDCCTTNGLLETEKGKNILSLVEYYLKYGCVYPSCKICPNHAIIDSQDTCVYIYKDVSSNLHTRPTKCPLDELEDNIKAWYNGTFCNGFHESDNDVAFANYLLEFCK